MLTYIYPKQKNCLVVCSQMEFDLKKRKLMTLYFQREKSSPEEFMVKGE